MMNEVAETQFKTARILAFAIMVVAPVIYVIIAMVLNLPLKSGGEIDMLFYILLIVAFVQPAAGLIIERHQVSAYRTRSDTKMTPAQLLTTIMIIKTAIVEAVFIYGLVVYLLSGDLQRMLIFYPVGAVWAAIHWPRREKWTTLIQLLEIS